MTTVTIPATSQTVCDACGVVCTQMNRRQEGGIVLKRHGLDMQGDPVGNASWSGDLCDACLGRCVTALNTVIAGGKL